MTRMAVLAFSLAAASAPLSALAQDRSKPARPDEIQDLLRKQRRASIERRVGWGLTGAGLAGIATGGIVLGFGLDRGSWSDVYPVVVTGSVSLALGGLMFVPGIVLALHGQERLTEAEWRLRQLGVLPTLAAGPGGLVIGARGTF